MEGEGSSSSWPIVITDSPKCSPIKITKRAAEYRCVPGMAVGTLYVSIEASDNTWRPIIASLLYMYMYIHHMI